MWCCFVQWVVCDVSNTLWSFKAFGTTDCAQGHIPNYWLCTGPHPKLLTVHRATSQTTDCAQGHIPEDLSIQSLFFHAIWTAFFMCCVLRATQFLQLVIHYLAFYYFDWWWFYGQWPQSVPSRQQHIVLLWQTEHNSLQNYAVKYIIYNL